MLRGRKSQANERKADLFMRNTLTAIFAGLGMGVFVGGIMGMIGGIFQRDQVRVIHGLGPFDGQWDPDNVKFLGAILASIGSAIFTFAMLMRRKP
jgi:hypothetical protein